MKGVKKMIFDYCSCLFGIIKIFLYKIIYFNRIHFNTIPKVNSSIKLAIKNGSKLLFGVNFRCRNCVSFRLYDKSIVSIGNNCFFNDGCSINARKKITIGNNVKFGHNVIVIDNDHDYKNDMDNYVCDEIKIGNNVWIGANCVILKGVTIGDDSIIAAGTIINKDVDCNTIVHNKLNVIHKEK